MADDRYRWRSGQGQHRSWDDRDRYREGAYFRGEEGHFGPGHMSDDDDMRDRYGQGGRGGSQRGGNDWGSRGDERGMHGGEGYGRYGRQYAGDDEWGGRHEDYERGAYWRGDENRRYGSRGPASYTSWSSDWRDQDRGYGRGYGNENAGGRSYERGGQASRDHRGGQGGDRGWWDRTTDEVASWFGDDDASRRRQQDAWRDQHRGRGPRGYTRSDERIREDINDRLTDHPVLDATDIEVSVSSGEVTLSGNVDSRYAKRLAEDIADDVSGVMNVQNNLRVRDRRSAVLVSSDNAQSDANTGATRGSVTDTTRTSTATTNQSGSTTSTRTT